LHFSPYFSQELKLNVWIGDRFRPQNWLLLQGPLTDRKTNFRLFIYSHISTISANWVKIGLVDVEIIGLTESLKVTKQQYFISHLQLRFAQPGGLIKTIKRDENVRRVSMTTAWFTAGGGLNVSTVSKSVQNSQSQTTFATRHVHDISENYRSIVNRVVAPNHSNRCKILLNTFTLTFLFQKFTSF